MTRLVWLTLLLGVLRPGLVDAQVLPIPITIEGRVGYAFPTGTFGTDEGARAGAGPGFGAGVSARMFGIVGVYAGYQRVAFDCSPCSTFGLDGSIASESVEAGIEVAPTTRFVGLGLWGRGGVLYHALGYSGDGQDIVSDRALGVGGAVGGSLRIGPGIDVRPALRFFYAPAEFDFSFGTTRTLDVTAVALDLGAAVTF